MGLDPPTVQILSNLLHVLARTMSPRLLLALRPQDLLPSWITHVVRLEPSCQIADQGEKEEVLLRLSKSAEGHVSRSYTHTEQSTHPTKQDNTEALVEMQGIQVKYGTKTVLGGWSTDNTNTAHHGLWWTIRRGQRWGVFGPNGSSPCSLPQKATFPKT